MPGKVQAYVEMANETAASITQDAEAWIPRSDWLRMLRLLCWNYVARDDQYHFSAYSEGRNRAVCLTGNGG